MLVDTDFLPCLCGGTTSTPSELECSSYTTAPQPRTSRELRIASRQVLERFLYIYASFFSRSPGGADVKLCY